MTRQEFDALDNSQKWDAYDDAQTRSKNFENDATVATAAKTAAETAKTEAETAQKAAEESLAKAQADLTAAQAQIATLGQQLSGVAGSRTITTGLAAEAALKALAAQHNTTPEVYLQEIVTQILTQVAESQEQQILGTALAAFPNLPGVVKTGILGGLGLGWLAAAPLDQQLAGLEAFAAARFKALDRETQNTILAALGIG